MADKVTELELKNIIGQEINNSMGYMGGNLSAQRKKSLTELMKTILNLQTIKTPTVEKLFFSLTINYSMINIKYN